MSAIFGGSKQKSKQQSTSTQVSGNQAYPWAMNTYGPIVQQGNSATSAISALLGLGGDRAGSDAAYENYKGSTGFQQTLDSGMKTITGSNAARGLLGSGSTLKALSQFGQDTSQKYFTDYITKLLSLAQNGLNAGQLVTGAGNYSQGNSQSTGNSSGSSTGGFAALLGAAA